MKPTALNKKNLSYPKPSGQQQTKMQCAPLPEWFGSVSDRVGNRSNALWRLEKAFSILVYTQKMWDLRLQLLCDSQVVGNVEDNVIQIACEYSLGMSLFSYLFFSSLQTIASCFPAEKSGSFFSAAFSVFIVALPLLV